MSPIPRDRRQAGFTVMELVVGMVVLAEVLVGALMLFDVNSKLARVQIQVADMQQGLRSSQHELVRVARMAGRGPFPIGELPDGLAVGVIDDAAEDTPIAVGDPEGGSPRIVEGTDVLRIRGVISTPLFQVDTADGSAYTIDQDAARITVHGTTKDGIPQDLQALKEAIDDGLPEAILVVSTTDGAIYAVGELLPSASSYDEADGSATEVTLQIDFGDPGSDSTMADQYLALSPEGQFPVQLTSVAFVGILEEYKFYVRQDYVVEGDSDSEPTPKFSRARFFPGTERGHGAGAEERAKSLKGDVADNVLDFQVALGVDTDGDESVVDAEWFFSDPDAEAVTTIEGELYYLRLNTLVQTDRRDFEYRADELTRIENRLWDADAPENTREQRMYRRRSVQTLVQLRNL